MAPILGLIRSPRGLCFGIILNIPSFLYKGTYSRVVLKVFAAQPEDEVQESDQVLLAPLPGGGVLAQGRLPLLRPKAAVPVRGQAREPGDSAADHRPPPRESRPERSAEGLPPGRGGPAPKPGAPRSPFLGVIFPIFVYYIHIYIYTFYLLFMYIYILDVYKTQEDIKKLLFFSEGSIRGVEAPGAGPAEGSAPRAAAALGAARFLPGAQK